MTRLERIAVLVWSLGDAVVSLSGSREPRRLSASERVVCPSCAGERVVVDRFGRSAPCLACDYGSGPLGRVWVDGMTGERTGAPGSAAVLRVAVERRVRVGCSWCQEGPRSRWDVGRGSWVPVEGRWEVLPRGSGVRFGERCWACDGSGWRLVSPDVEGEKSGRERLGSVAWSLPGSYAELDVALSVVRAQSPRRYRALVTRLSRGEWPLANTSALQGLAEVAALMPERVRVSAGVLEAWRERGRRGEMIRGPRRDQRIRELVSRGEPVAVVARRAGLSERQVRRIVGSTSGGAAMMRTSVPDISSRPRMP